MEITYDIGSPRDHLRCHLAQSYRTPRSIFMLLIVPVLATITFGGDMMDTNAAGFGVLLLGTTALWICITIWLMWRRIQKRCATPMVCGTRLTPEGVLDIAGATVSALTWTHVTNVHSRNGDIFIWRLKYGGVYIPCSAFQDSAQAERFTTAARAAHRGDISLLAPATENGGAWSQSSAWPAATAPSNVWPPPPNVAGYGGAPAPGQIDWSRIREQEKRIAKKQQFIDLRTALCVLIVTFSVLMHHLLPSRYPLVLLGDFVVVIVFVIGQGGIWIAESRWKRQ